MYWDTFKLLELWSYSAYLTADTKSESSSWQHMLWTSPKQVTFQLTLYIPEAIPSTYIGTGIYYCYNHLSSTACISFQTKPEMYSNKKGLY